MMKKYLLFIKYQLHESGRLKKNLSKFWLAYMAYSFQSFAYTKANRLYNLSPYNRGGDRTVAMVEL